MNQAAKRQAFKDGMASAETYLGKPVGGGIPDAPFSPLSDDGYELSMIWAKGFNFALVLAGICKMSAETELAVRDYEPEYFAANLPEFPLAHHAAILERQRARAKADPESNNFARAGKEAAEAGQPATECPHVVDSHAYALWMIGYESAFVSKDLPKGGGLLEANESIITDDGNNVTAAQALATMFPAERSALPGEYFALAAPSMRGQVIILCRTTGEQAAHTPKFKAEEAHLALHTVDALNDAYAAGILQGNRTRQDADVVADAERLRWLLDESGAEDAVVDFWSDCRQVVVLDRKNIDEARGK